ncbi:MAG: hypothetical protein WC632_07740 [Candidatus Margulisiibacteriota bacterium]
MTKKILVGLALLLCFAPLAYAGWDGLTTGTTKQLNAAAFFNKDLGFIVGETGTELKTVTAGASFDVAAVGAVALTDVVVLSGSEAYLAGGINGLYKTTDGTNFSAVTIAGTIIGADFRRGSAYGSRIAFAAYKASPAGSFLYYSNDSGGSFTSVALSETAFEVYGVVLTSDATWEWGSLGGGTYALVKNDVTVWTGTTPVRDLFFANNLVGYAVGDSGLVLRTANGGGSAADWQVKTTGFSQNFRAAYFVNTDTGWLAGDSGLIAFTKDSGTSYFQYPGTSASVNYQDLAIVTTLEAGTNVVYAYAAGSGGTVGKLASPTIGALSTISRTQGWLGTIEVTGTNFIPGAVLSFSGSGIAAYGTTVESATKLRATIAVSSTAPVGAVDATVTNPDLTFVTNTGAFTVTANNGAVTINEVWFDGVKYPTPALAVNAQPAITFAVTTSASTLTKSGLNAKVLVIQSGSNNTYSIPESAVTLNGTTKASVVFSLPAKMSTGWATIELYAEDVAGNVSQEVLPVDVPPSSGTVAQGKNLFDVLPVPYKVDLESEDLVLYFKSKVAVTLDQGATVLIYTAAGGAPAFSKNYSGPITNGSKIIIPKRSLPAALQRVCIALVQIVDNNTKRIVASGKFALVDKRYGM